jgi:hypothetical protein
MVLTIPITPLSKVEPLRAELKMRAEEYVLAEARAVKVAITSTKADLAREEDEVLSPGVLWFFVFGFWFLAHPFPAHSASPTLACGAHHTSSALARTARPCVSSHTQERVRGEAIKYARSGNTSSNGSGSNRPVTAPVARRTVGQAKVWGNNIHEKGGGDFNFWARPFVR